MTEMTPVRIGIVGCGAIAQLNHVPALQALAARGSITVRMAVDPDQSRRENVARPFAGARGLARLEDLSAGEIDLAVIATPVRFHAPQAIWLLERGIHVFCEKPLAATCAEGEAMIAAAQRANRLLAVGLFRRFFPASQAIQEFVVANTFGRLRGFEVEEGGPFNWPAATPSFFDPQQAGGGVLLDVGSHVLDLLTWWLGEPETLEYRDDVEGGLEAMSWLRLRFVDGCEGTVLLSRDVKTRNRWTLEFERATVVWRVGESNRIEIRHRNAKHWLVSRLEEETPAGRQPADSYQQAFTRQLLKMIEGVVRGEMPNVTGADGLRALRLIERCYRERTPLFAENP